MQFFKTPNIDFISKRKFAYVFSAALILMGIVAVIVRGGYNYSIDFKGGTSMVVRFRTPVQTETIRTILSKIGYGTSEIKQFGNTYEYLIYIEQQKNLTASEVAKQVAESFANAPETKDCEIRQVDTVGPKVGKELRKKAVMAILISLIVILIYIGYRFEFVFAIGAVVAVFHDVLVVLGFFPILNYEISLKEIAAFLTIVGCYSTVFVATPIAWEYYKKRSSTMELRMLKRKR